MRMDLPLNPSTISHCLLFIIPASICLPLAWITVSARLWTRVRILNSAGLDDIFMAISAVLYTVFCGAVYALIGVTLGLNSVPTYLMTLAANLLLTAEVFYITAMVFVKLSLGMFFLRIVTERWQTMLVKAIMAISVTFGLAYMLFVIFQCGAPIQGPTFWMKTLAKQCVPDEAILGMGFAHGILTAATDLIFAILPIPIIRTSTKPFREKAMIVGILMIGTVGGIASIVRVFWIKILTTPDMNYFVDIIWLGMWSGIEAGLGIVAGSLATLRPLVRKFSKKARSSFRLSDMNDSDHKMPPAILPKHRPMEKRGLSLLDDSQGSTLISFTSSDHGMDIMSRRSRWLNWWRAPKFNAGLMTEFDQGMRAVESKNRNIGTVSRSDVIT